MVWRRLDLTVVGRHTSTNRACARPNSSVAQIGIKSSPHRPFMSMPTSSRLYHCIRCRAQVVICRRCDRGQRYCTNGCSQEARDASRKRASKKYQTTRAGRFNNAARQRRFRTRQKQKVTHHRSIQIPLHDVLLSKPSSPQCDEKKLDIKTFMACHYCGVAADGFFRSDFLRTSRLKPVFRRQQLGE